MPFQAKTARFPTIPCLFFFSLLLPDVPPSTSNPSQPIPLKTSTSPLEGSTTEYETNPKYTGENSTEDKIFKTRKCPHIPPHPIICTKYDTSLIAPSAWRRFPTGRKLVDKTRTVVAAPAARVKHYFVKHFRRQSSATGVPRPGFRDRAATPRPPRPGSARGRGSATGEKIFPEYP